MPETENQTSSAPKAAYMHSHWLMRTDRLRQAWTCLALCLAGYAGACAFWRYLASGQWVNFRPAVFYRDLTIPLGEVFRHPLDVLTYPWMILALGLGLGLLVLVPLILAVLYRPTTAVGLILSLILLGHMPVLALAVGGRTAGRRRTLNGKRPTWRWHWVCFRRLGISPCRPWQAWTPPSCCRSSDGCCTRRC